MNKTVNMIFVVLGGAFLILLLVGVGFYLSVTLSNSPASYYRQPAGAISSDNTSGTSTGELGGTEFTLTDAQKQALVSFGIDPASVPSSISAKQEECFVAELGNERVKEIKAGDTPSAMDFFRAKVCI